MKMLTVEIKKKLIARSQQKNQYGEPLPFKDTDPVICKFFNPVGIGDWYIMSGEEVPNYENPEKTDWLFFGLCVLQYAELGSVTLHQLESVKLPFQSSIERDLYYDGTWADLKEIMNTSAIH